MMTWRWPIRASLSQIRSGRILETCNHSVPLPRFIVSMASSYSHERSVAFFVAFHGARYRAYDPNRVPPLDPRTRRPLFDSRFPAMSRRPRSAGALSMSVGSSPCRRHRRDCFCDPVSRAGRRTPSRHPSALRPIARGSTLCRPANPREVCNDAAVPGLPGAVLAKHPLSDDPHAPAPPIRGPGSCTSSAGYGWASCSPICSAAEMK